MKASIFTVAILGGLVFLSASAQQDFLVDDYKAFGRKEPASLGSFFGSLGTQSVPVNPSNVALVTDNRITVGGAGSSIGNGYFISWVAPNFSISSASQKISIGENAGFKQEKRLLHFNFGISTKDLGYGGSERELALGIAVKRQADQLLDMNERTINEGKGVSLDLGLTLSWRPIAVEFAVIHLTNAELNDSGMRYGRSFVFGGRFSRAAGLILALQGVKGETCAGSDFGLNLGAEQSFFEHRLITRIQLTSFFLGPEATMQNISSSIGYRLSPRHNLPTILTDMEFCDALSFLSMPKNVGTHMVVVSKFF